LLEKQRGNVLPDGQIAGQRCAKHVAKNRRGKPGAFRMARDSRSFFVQKHMVPAVICETGSDPVTLPSRACIKTPAE
jgi:hypothetical protein